MRRRPGGRGVAARASQQRLVGVGPQQPLTVGWGRGPRRRGCGVPERLDEGRRRRARHRGHGGRRAGSRRARASSGLGGGRPGRGRPAAPPGRTSWPGRRVCTSTRPAAGRGRRPAGRPGPAAPRPPRRPGSAGPGAPGRSRGRPPRRPSRAGAAPPRCRRRPGRRRARRSRVAPVTSTTGVPARRLELLAHPGHAGPQVLEASCRRRPGRPRGRSVPHRRAVEARPSSGWHDRGVAPLAAGQPRRTTRRPAAATGPCG